MYKKLPFHGIEVTETGHLIHYDQVSAYPKNLLQPHPWDLIWVMQFNTLEDLNNSISLQAAKKTLKYFDERFSFLKQRSD